MQIEKVDERAVKKRSYEDVIATCTRMGVSCVEDVASILGMTMDDFNDLFPIGDIQRRVIEDEIFATKRKSIINIRARLFNSNNPTALMNLYKMFCTEEERDKFTSVKADITSNGKEIKPDPIIVEIIDKSTQVEPKE